MIASNIICRGASRFLNKAYFQDVQISGTASFASISASGDITAGGNLKSTTGNLYLKNLLAINGQTDSWLRINANNAFSTGTFFGTNIVRTDGTFQVGPNGAAVNIYYGNNNANKAMTVSIPATFNGTTTTISNLVAPIATINNATITGDLTVGGVLQANDFIKNIVKAVGGQLYVSPTFQALNSTTVTCTAVTTTQLSLTLSDSAINGTDYAGATWYKDSQVMLSGTLTANTTGHTEEIIFSSVPGIVTANMSNSNKLQIKLDYSGASTYFKTGTLTTSDVAVMMYQICIPSGSTNAGLHPIGIYIKAYGTDKNSYIDIFGGTSNTPNARLGLLNGLTDQNNNPLQINGNNVNGWGIMTKYGYFDGTIVSSSGRIGAFTLSSDLRSGTWGTSGSVLVAGGYTPTNADAKSIGGSPTTGNTWAFTAGNAFGVTTAGTLYANSAVVSGAITAGANSQIGPWNVTATSIYKVSNTLGSGTSGAAYFGNDGLSVGNKFKVDASGVATLGLSTGYHATMDTNSFDVLNGSTMLATFGETATIGNMSARGVSIDTNGFKFNNGGQQNFFIGINSRSGDTITSANATITDGSSQTTINNIKYYRAAAISSGQTVISVVGHLESAIENGEPIISNAEFENVDSWVVDGGYLWVEDGYSTYSSFEESITYTYVTSNTSNLPYMVLGISDYDNNNIPGIISFVQGYKNKATGSFSTALGASTVASGKGAFACGSGTKANGDWSFACGSNTTALLLGSFACGEDTNASSYYSFAQGYRSEAAGKWSHAEGYRSKSSGDYSHAEAESTSIGQYSHSEGHGCLAVGDYSHAEGHATKTYGAYSHASGLGTVTTEPYQLVIGKYNRATVSGDFPNYTYSGVDNCPFIIGKGTGNATAHRSNAFTVDWSGNVVASGSVLAKGATLTGALSGTSASFSSTLTATGAITGGSFSTTGSVSCASVTATGNVMAANTSHIGMIIMSTTLNTMAKVIEVYGGTTWIQHSGYMLYGAVSNVVANSAVKTGGEETHTLTVNEMPSHSHSVSSGWEDSPGIDRIVYSAKNGGYNDYALGWVQFIQSTGGGQAHNNMPPYKNVYIWERTA